MAGETALARQLKKLAAPQTTGLIQDKIRKSFLYDHRVAAGLGRDHFFAHGTNGIEKLCNVNPLFSKFESNLFSLSYIDFERSVQSSEVNKKLDEKIREFLRMLSPYFMLRASHEALEWLIYRYHIHMYNVDDLIASVIPHFNTSVFVRVVQLMDLEERSRWFWLKPVQESGVCLDYSAILNKFISDGSFRRIIFEIAPNVLSVYQGHESVAVPIISFSMLTAYNALSRYETFNAEIINTSFLEYMIKGLKSKLSCYTGSSYMIVSQLILKANLTAERIKCLLITVFENIKQDLIKDAVELLLIAFQKKAIKALPHKVYSVLLSDQEFSLAVFNLAENFEISSLLHALISKTISSLFNMSIYGNKKKEKKVLKFFKQLLVVMNWDEKCVIKCFRVTLIKCSKSKGSKKVLRHLKKNAGIIIKNLERKYPDYFDKAYRMFLEKEVKSNKKALCNLINNSVCKIKYKVLPSMKTSLVLGLNHANSNVRKTSASHFVDFLEQLLKENEISDRKFIEDAVYDRLLDSNPTVVLAILSKPDVIIKILGKTKTLATFESMFSKPIKLHSPWYAVHMKCLNIIAHHFNTDGNVFDVFQIILHLLFPVNEHTIEGFKYLLRSDINNMFLQYLRVLLTKLDNPKDDYFEVNHMVVACLRDLISKMEIESRKTFASFLLSKISSFRYNSFFVFYINAMLYLVQESIDDACNDAVKYIQDLLKVFRFYLMQSNIKLEVFKDMSQEDCIRDCLKFLNVDKFPVSIIYHAFSEIITGVKLSFEWKSWPSMSEDFLNYYSILSNIFDFCILLLNSEKEILKDYSKSMLSLFFNNQFKSVQTIFMFLSTKWFNYMKDVSFAVQFSAISIASAFCNGQSDMNWLFENDMIFLCLILAVSDNNPQISQTALNLISSALSYTGNSVTPFKRLGEDIIMKSEEIKSDNRQCFVCIGNWLKPGTEKMDSKTSDRVSNQLLQCKISVVKQILNLLTQDQVPHSMKHFLVLCLENVDSTTILSAYIPVLYNYLNLLAEANCERYLLIIDLFLQKFTPKTAVCITEKSEETKALLHCLNFVNTDKDIERSIQISALKVLSKEFFSSIKSVTVQQDIFEILLTLYMNSPTNVNTKVEKVLRKLCTYAYLFLKHFQDKELSVSKSTTLREAKKLKSKGTDLDNFATFEDGAWKKIIVFLELMQNKSKLHKKEILVPELFNLLNKSLDFDSQAPVEYLRQLILSAIYTCCEQLGPGGLDERQFQVELIVQCIRTSTNAKTHHQSLLLLNLAATMFPDYVLSNVMSIFTFMGSSLVRQDDSYSFQVISQTIETIVPSLLEASNQQTETDGIQVVASVIRVFVDSLSDIPSHRQLPLFTKLITTLGPSQYLWIPIGQICDQYATVFHDVTTGDSENWKISPTLEFALNLQKRFPPHTQIDSCIKLMNFIVTLPESKEQLESCPASYSKIKEPFNVSNHSYKQIQIYKLNVLSYMKIWLSSQAFLSQVSELNRKELCNLEERYEELLKSVLTFLQNRLSVKQGDKDDRNIANEVQLLYNLVYAINSLLPCELFIKVIRPLLSSSEEEIQIKAIELLNTNLEQQPDFTNPENHKLLKKLLRPLVNLSNKYLNEELENNRHAIVQQNALYALHLLTKLIGPVYPNKFYKVLSISVTILNKCTQPELTVNALLCLAQLCNCLGVSILPHLNSFMPIIITVLQDRKIFNMSECLILGIIAALLSIIENLGIFLSSYMEAIITGICVFSVKYSKLGKNAISEKFVSLQSKLANEIPLRVLLTAIESSYRKLSSENSESVVPLMRILTEKLNCSNYDDIMAYSNQLQEFYINLLDFRNCYAELPVETTAVVESNIVSSLQIFIMKLSVTRFRTFFQKIYQWCTATVDDQEQKYRVFTFYKLTGELSKSLKSLFSHMSVYFFRHVASLLDLINSSKSKTLYFDSDKVLSHELLINVLDTLNYCFMYSKEQMLDKEHFDLLMQPLIDQLENVSDEIKYQEIVENHLNKCIAHFMTAVSDNALWKALNYQLLLKTRHDSPKVRFGSLQVLREVVNNMGDNYLVLLPESIPFLAEMMEDESTEVEQECQTVIIEMEKILGEPIRKYF